MTLETLSEMCDISDDEKRKAIPMMLQDNAFRIYAKNKHKVSSYDQEIALLKGWYTSEEKQTRMLNQWKNSFFRGTIENARHI